jgi:hypothetical protein
MTKTWNDDRLAVFFTIPSVPCGATVARIARDVYGISTRDNADRVRDVLERAARKGWVRHKSHEGHYLTRDGFKKQWDYEKDYHGPADVALGVEVKRTRGRMAGVEAEWRRYDDLFTSVKRAAAERRRGAG